MSAPQISDLELDRLLSQAPPPRSPAADLADRIAARALRTPQRPANRFHSARRHGPRRRATIWTAVVAANLMAAAAAAASWDGQRFDFHRLTELPHRVAAAIHIGHHQPPRALAVRRKAGPPPHSVPPMRAVVVSPVTATPLESAPAAVSAKPPVQLRIPDRPLERPRVIEPREPSAQQARRFAHFQHRVAAVRPQIARVRPIEPVERTPRGVPPPPQERAWNEGHSQERTEQTVAAAERRQTVSEATARAPSAESVSPPQTAPQSAENGQTELGRRRFARWRNQFLKREHPRERGNRFRRRF